MVETPSPPEIPLRSGMELGRRTVPLWSNLCSPTVSLASFLVGQRTRADVGRGEVGWGIMKEGIGGNGHRQEGDACEVRINGRVLCRACAEGRYCRCEVSS